ncbi:MAG: aminoglycoside phosphotransferase family protein [Candidatus Nanopelagicales bacterium]
MTTPSAAAREAAAEWDLELVEKTSSRYSDTWFALRDGTHVVVKVGDPVARRREATALGAFRGAAVQVLAAAEGALLLERVLPGDDLRPVAARDDDLATRIIGTAVTRLQADPAPTAGLPPLATLDESFDRFARRPTPDVPADLVDRTRALVRELTVPGADDVVLHGDLHHENVLRSGWSDGPDVDWVVIDPHGWIGDPVFDTSVSLLNPHDLIATHPDPVGLTRRRAAVLAEVTGFDRDRIEAWAQAAALISELWCWEDHGFVAGGPLRLAAGLARS